MGVSLNPKGEKNLALRILQYIHFHQKVKKKNLTYVCTYIVRIQMLLKSVDKPKNHFQTMSSQMSCLIPQFDYLHTDSDKIVLSI